MRGSSRVAALGLLVGVVVGGMLMLRPFAASHLFPTGPRDLKTVQPGPAPAPVTAEVAQPAAESAPAELEQASTQPVEEPLPQLKNGRAIAASVHSLSAIPDLRAGPGLRPAPLPVRLAPSAEPHMIVSPPQSAPPAPRDPLPMEIELIPTAAPLLGIGEKPRPNPATEPAEGPGRHG